MSTKKNTNLHAAKKAKNDEFYTMFEDIQKEVFHYKDHFKGKTVFLNCDDDSSNFWKYFKANFTEFGLERLIATHYNSEETSYKLEIIKGCDEEIKTPLSGNGDFRSPESEALLKESDIVVTNPPFSLFREYIDQLVTHKKEFLVVGSMNAISYKEIFPLIMSNNLWLGVNGLKEFTTPDGSIRKFGNILWYTNLNHYKRNEEIGLSLEYTEDKYPMYDNYPIIEVGKVVNIPHDYFEEMCVPISFLSKYNPKQFEITGYMNGGWKDWTLQGKHKYDRIIIKRNKEV